MMIKLFSFASAALCVSIGSLLVLLEPLLGRRFNLWIGSLLLGFTLCITALIAERWIAFGQGPFLTMYEILLSSLFGLGFIYTMAYWRFQSVRIGAPIALGVMLLLMIWMTKVDPRLQLLPPTYETPWLWIHVVAGKLFLGSCLVAASVAISLLLPTSWRRPLLALHQLSARTLEETVWRWLLVAFLFHSAMLVAGAVWAQDAWGRFWDWDPLETWAFSTWVCMAVGLHARMTWRLGPRIGSAIVVSAFVLAFLTFFGVPFVSLSPHQGAV